MLQYCFFHVMAFSCFNSLNLGHLVLRLFEQLNIKDYLTKLIVLHFAWPLLPMMLNALAYTMSLNHPSLAQ